MKSLRLSRTLAARCVVIAMFIFAAVLIVAPRLLGWQLHMVLSGSMAPTLGLGSVVAVEPLPAARVEVGDVITFSRRSGIPVTHRVVDVIDSGGSRQFLTKGDANEDPDPEPRPAGAVVGEVQVHVPYMGYLAYWLRQPLGLLLLLVLPGAVFILLELRSLISAQGRRHSDTTTDGEATTTGEQRTPVGDRTCEAAHEVAQEGIVGAASAVAAPERGVPTGERSAMINVIEGSR
jgi:signal peptidase